MFKTLACVYLVAAVAAYTQAAAVDSSSSNTAINLNSDNSQVLQNNIQNADAVDGVNPAVHPVVLPNFAPPIHGFLALHAVPHGGFFIPTGGVVNSHSSNTGANIGSDNSAVVQNAVQNAAAVN